MPTSSLSGTSVATASWIRQKTCRWNRRKRSKACWCLSCSQLSVVWVATLLHPAVSIHWPIPCNMLCQLTDSADHSSKRSSWCCWVAALLMCMSQSQVVAQALNANLNLMWGHTLKDLTPGWQSINELFLWRWLRLRSYLPGTTSCGN